MSTDTERNLLTVGRPGRWIQIDKRANLSLNRNTGEGCQATSIDVNPIQNIFSIFPLAKSDLVGNGRTGRRIPFGYFYQRFCLRIHGPYIALLTFVSLEHNQIAIQRPGEVRVIEVPFALLAKSLAFGIGRP